MKWTVHFPHNSDFKTLKSRSSLAWAYEVREAVCAKVYFLPNHDNVYSNVIWNNVFFAPTRTFSANTWHCLMFMVMTSEIMSFSCDLGPWPQSLTLNQSQILWFGKSQYFNNMLIRSLPSQSCTWAIFVMPYGKTRLMEEQTVVS